MTIFSLSYFFLVTIALIVFYLLSKTKYQWVVLLISSIVFYYFSGGLKAGLFITITIVTTFTAARVMERFTAEQNALLHADPKPDAKEKKRIRAAIKAKKDRVLVIALLLNFGILAVLKYGSFVSLNLNSLFGKMNAGMSIPVPHFLLPLGISFYTFQTTGYLIDVNRGRVTANDNIFKFALFSSWFPQIIQGPIGDYSELSPQLFGSHSFDKDSFRRGLYRLLWGYFKKMVIAERVSVVVRAVLDNYQTEQFTGLALFTGVLLYGVQMYGDFSGGIDIVIGISELFGVSMKENFRNPYMSRSVSEFWQRWHISLGDWMKNYVFYPIALSKKFANLQKALKSKVGPYYGKVLPTALASFIVFVIVGVWHGAAWRYVVFGVYHASLTSLDTLIERPAASWRAFLRIDGESFAWKLFQALRTIFLVTIGRYFDCSESLRSSLDMLRTSFRFNPWVFTDGTFLKMGASLTEWFMIILMIILLVTVDIVNERGTCIREVFAKQGIVFRWLIYFAALIAIFKFGMYGPGYNAATFIYQGF